MERKIALITGGKRGIGKAIALRLCSDGFHCIITGTSNDYRALNSEMEYVQADFAVESDVERLEEYARGRSIDVLVNNVGINIKGSTDSYNTSDLKKLIDVNLETPFRLIRSCLPHMKTKQWGRIVNITSLWGVISNPENAAYSASKFGLDGMTSSIAGEVAKDNILLNSIAPGYIYTEAAQDAYSESELELVSKAIPIGRLGMPEEIASLASWLVGRENTYMTGQNLVVDGGLTRTAYPR